MPSRPIPVQLLNHRQHQLWLCLKVNVVHATVARPDQSVKRVAMVVTALMVCPASLAIAVHLLHQHQN